MFTVDEMKNINEVLNKNCICVLRKKDHVHNFIFNGATRQEVCFSCFGCGALSYIYYDKNYKLFELVVLRCLLNNDYISESFVNSHYISKTDLDKEYVPKHQLISLCSDENYEDDEDDEIDYLS